MIRLMPSLLSQSQRSFANLEDNAFDLYIFRFFDRIKESLQRSRFLFGADRAARSAGSPRVIKESMWG